MHTNSNFEALSQQIWLQQTTHERLCLLTKCNNNNKYTKMYYYFIMKINIILCVIC